MLNKIISNWKTITAIIAIVSTIGGLAIAGNEIVKDQNEYKQAIVDLSRIAKKVDSRDFLVDWLKVHGVDSTTIKQWTIYPRHILRDSTGTPLLNILFLDPNFLPEKGLLKMYIKEDSIITIQTLWDYPKKGK